MNPSLVSTNMVIRAGEPCPKCNGQMFPDFWDKDVKSCLQCGLVIDKSPKLERVREFRLR